MCGCAGRRIVFRSGDPPRPPRGVVLFAPCSFNSLNKLAHGIADSLALSVVAEAIGRRTPVIVAPSLNQPLLDHPQAQASLQTLPGWGVTIVPPVDDGRGAAPGADRAAARRRASVRADRLTTTFRFRLKVSSARDGVARREKCRTNRTAPWLAGARGGEGGAQVHLKAKPEAQACGGADRAARRVRGKLLGLDE